MTVIGLDDETLAKVRREDSVPEDYLNRELSWLQFNWRVLEEAENENHPLLERLRFLSISASNLDEFFTVRAAGLRQLVTKGHEQRSQDGLTPTEQLIAIHEEATRLSSAQQARWDVLRRETEAEDISIVEPTQLTEAERDWVQTLFEERLYAQLTPISVDVAHQFPFIPPGGSALGLTLEHVAKPGEIKNAIVPVPMTFDRFLLLPRPGGRSRGRSQSTRFIRMEKLIEMFVPQLFLGYEVKAVGLFRVLRDSDIEIEEEAEDLIGHSETLDRRRRRGSVIRLEVDTSMPSHLRQFVAAELEVEPEEIAVLDGLIGLADTSQLIAKDKSHLLFPPYQPRHPERIREFKGDCFAAIRTKDIVIHHPYESFDIVVQFLRQAVVDPDVVAIKWTLYRTSKDSPIVQALKDAAASGKAVTAIIELKARFDETANLQWARDLEREGANVVFGFLDLKTHAKLGQVVRMEGGQVRTYCHLGTGNYHPITAKIYTDLSYFTAHAGVGRDVTNLFNFVTSSADAPKLEYLAMSPNGIKALILRHIATEIDNAKAGKPSGVWLKMNSLVDADIIDALYCASAANVPVDLVVRGICCLRPGVPGLSENIRAKSVVGRFLEHSRIYCFANGEPLPSPKAAVYFGSADLMPRNLERRVEVISPLLNETVHEQVLEQIMLANLKDSEQSWEGRGDGSWVRMQSDNEDGFNLHDYFMKNPSLSGRGGSLKESTPPRIAIQRNEPPAPNRVQQSAGDSASAPAGAVKASKPPRVTAATKH